MSFLGFRTPAARHASVAGFPPHTRHWFAQGERLMEVEKLRARLANNHVPHAPRWHRGDALLPVWSANSFTARRAAHDRIHRVCQWALARIERADAAYAPAREQAA